MKLSVIIPAYNEEERLPRLMKSLRAQEFSDFEIIVADAKSTDVTRAIAAEHGARVVDGGMPGVGRNRGAEVAVGDYLLFLDADVELHPQALAIIMQECSERGLMAASSKIAPAERTLFARAMALAYNGYVGLVRPFLPHGTGSCMLAHASVHRAIGGFDEAITFAEDTDYVIRAVKSGARFNYLQRFQIPYDMRRFRRDGKLRTIWVHLLAELHIIFKGPIKTDILKYRFGYNKQDKA